MKIENLITKRSRLDRRLKLTREVSKWVNRKTLAATMYGLIIGALAGAYIADRPANQKVNSPKPLEQKIEVKQIEAQETPCDYDPITYLRCKGEQLGINEYEITKIISTMKCESGLRADALNKNKNGTFDIGIGQINDVHAKRISRADRMDFKKNIDFIYTLYQEQGLNPWVCAKNLGFIK